MWLYTTDPRMVAAFFFVLGFGSALVAILPGVRRG